MELRHDPEYLLRLSGEIDRLSVRGAGLLRIPELAPILADLRDYFLYLTLDALDDPGLARELVTSFEALEARSYTHRRFFFALGRLLSARHEISRLPGEEISREAFERSWERTVEMLGFESRGGQD